MTEKPKNRPRRRRSAKSPRRTHLEARHGHVSPLPATPLQSVPISIDGRLIGEVRVQPGTEEEVTSRAIATLIELREWSQLGAEIVDLGEHRLKIAAHAARVAATGGRGFTLEEAIRLAEWFRGIVELAIQRGGMRAARAIWFVLASDKQRDPHRTWSPRCPWLEAIGPAPALREESKPPGDADQRNRAWLGALLDASASYVHLAVAGATLDDIEELRALIQADDNALDALYAPEPLALADNDPHEGMYEAMSALTRRRLLPREACSALENWAFSSHHAMQEHAWEPPARLGICAWLARVALRDEERAA